ncbi:MAG: hypothetical protein Q9M92_16900 [Enterobacterales bacterium]|nr:hypothetical protein [Enterobacterales bacterium]
MNYSLFVCVFLMTFMLLGCDRFNTSNQAEVVESEDASRSAVKIPISCKQLVKVQDIWRLEPMLLKSGKIKESMDQAEKETIIHQYIEAKNRQYKACLSSKGKKVK